MRHSHAGEPAWGLADRLGAGGLARPVPKRKRADGVRIEGESKGGPLARSRRTERDVFCRVTLRDPDLRSRDRDAVVDLDEGFGRNAQAFMQAPDHLQTQRPLTV